MAEDNSEQHELRQISLKRLLLSIDFPGSMSRDLGAESRVYLVTAAGVISGDIDVDDDENPTGLAVLEGKLAEQVEANGAVLDRDLLRLKKAQLRTPGGATFNFEALWISPENVIGLTYGCASETYL